MPNWVRNRMTVKFEKDTFKATGNGMQILNFIMKPLCTEECVFDFEKLIPIPDSYYADYDPSKTLYPSSALSERALQDYSDYVGMGKMPENMDAERHKAIHCFWYNKNDSAIAFKSLVIPDLCMDIILYENVGYHADFCGINNRPFYSVNTDTELFGIRFYAWAVALFTDDTMVDTLNACDCAQRYFCDFSNQTAEEIICAESLYEKKRLAENYLLKKLSNRSINPSVLNSVVYAIRHSGKATVKNLADDNAVSNRKLERDFLSTTGVSPKQMVNLIRYQLLWQDAVKRDFNVLDSVEKYGFFDQSHLLKEFKKYHGLTLTEARNEVLRLSHFYNT